MGNQTAATAARKQNKVFQIMLSLIFLAGFAVLAFIPDAAGLTGENIFDLFSRLFKDGADSLGRYTGYVLYGTLGFYGIMIALTVISFFIRAKGALILNYVKAAFAVIIFALFVLALRQDGIAGFDAILTSVNSILLSLALALLYVIVLNFAAYKKRGFVKLLLFLIAAAFFAFYNFKFVADLKFTQIFTFKLSLGEGMTEQIASYAFMALAFGAVANVALAGLDLILPKTGALDFIRALIFFAITVFAFIMLAVLTKFADIADYLGTICFLGLAAVQGIAVIVINAVKKNQSKKAEESKAENSFVFDANDQMAIKGFEAQPQTTESEQAAETAKASGALDDAAQISIDDIVKEQAVEEETAASAAAETEPAEEIIVEVEEKVAEETPEAEAAEEKTYEGEPQAEKPFDFEQAQYDGRFNREYADYTQQQSGQSQQATQTQQEPQQEPQQQQQTQQTTSGYSGFQQQAPYTYGQGYAQQFAQNYGAPYYGGPIPYMPDAFINGLSPAEKDEFDRLFISRIYGENKRLPVYQVGGDNREFFSKVFVFIGRYRNVISDGLLEKIYNQSNLLK